MRKSRFMNATSITTLRLWSIEQVSSGEKRSKAQLRIEKAVTKHLSSLSLCNLALFVLPDIFNDSALAHITELDVSGNDFDDFPPSITSLSTLRSLKFNRCPFITESALISLSTLPPSCMLSFRQTIFDTTTFIDALSTLPIAYCSKEEFFNIPDVVRRFQNLDVSSYVLK